MAGLLRASEDGLKIVNMARRNLGWNKTESSWCLAAFVSQATLKRFWARIAIRRENFINICKAIEIDDWEYIAEGYRLEKNEPLLVASIADIPHPTDAQTFTLPENLPPVWQWYDRPSEINTLKSLLLNQTHLTIPINAINIVGLPGTGKTTLVSQMIRQLHTENTPFVAVAYQTLQFIQGQTIPLDCTLDRLLASLSISTPTNLTETIAKTDKLLKTLKEKPCLIIFDNVETLLQTKDASKVGYFSLEQSAYAWFFQQLVETLHQSKIIFISRESLATFPPHLTRELTINGLEINSAIELLSSFPLSANYPTLTQLAHRYRGHPQALQLIANFITNDHEYQGQVSQFLSDRDWLLIPHLEHLIDQAIDRLSPLEKTCLTRIATDPALCDHLIYETIAAQMPEISKSYLKDHIILGLKRRQFLCYNQQQATYQLHPFIQAKADQLFSLKQTSDRTS